MVVIDGSDCDGGEEIVMMVVIDGGEEIVMMVVKIVMVSGGNCGD